MEAITRYRAWCAAHQLPVYMTDWWWDIVAPGWQVALLENGQGIQAAWPYWVYQTYGFKVLGNPPLTPYSGPWLNPPADLGARNQASFQEKMVEGLLLQLPKVSYTDVDLPPGCHYFLPWKHAGYQLAPRVTYLLDLHPSLEALQDQCKPTLRRQIKNAAQVLQVVETTDATVFFDLHRQSISRQGAVFKYDQALVQSLLDAANEREQGIVLMAVDASGNVHAAMFLVWDQHCAYYLAGGLNEAVKSSGAMSLLLWHTIKLAKEKGIPQFDFEGSMVASVERFFRLFGGTLQPYYKITKSTSVLWDLKMYLKR